MEVWLIAVPTAFAFRRGVKNRFRKSSGWLEFDEGAAIFALVVSNSLLHATRGSPHRGGNRSISIAWSCLLAPFSPFSGLKLGLEATLEPMDKFGLGFVLRRAFFVLIALPGSETQCRRQVGTECSGW